MKKRLDVLLTEKGLFSSREKAKAYIMSGEIFVNGEREDKPGSTFDEDCIIEHRGKSQKYVSRGGLKLEKAMQSFSIELEDKVCMDVGASTGGFTDCMLQNGAKKVYSIDVGYGQLDWKLRNDERVIVLEKTNARYLNGDIIPEKISFCSIDVSFISLTLILPAVFAVSDEYAEVVCLIKPQFEAGRENVGKKGVVKDPAIHRQVIEKVVSFAKSIGFSPIGLDFSPVKGPEGNIEYLLYLKKNNAENERLDIDETVSCAHEALD